MEKKVQKIFVDEGFGFPVKFINVPMVKARGVWTPNVDYNKLSNLLLTALAHKTSKLTGNEIRFIRLHFEMTVEQFGKRFGTTHPAVLKWEKTKNEPTAMTWAIEKDVRLFVLTKINKSATEVQKLYLELEEIPSEEPEIVELNLKVA